MNTSDRELARHWREWAEDTGRNVVSTADLRAQGIGHTDMRTAYVAAKRREHATCTL